MEQLNHIKRKRKKMSKLEIRDTATPTLERLFKLSQGLGMQSMSKGASDVVKEMKKDAQSAGKTDYHMRIKNGHRIITHKETSHKLLERYDHKTGKKLTPMWELIRFKQYPYTNTVLMGFLDTKGYTSLKYEGGVSRPYEYVKGTKTKAIMQRIVDGEEITPTAKQRGLFYHSFGDNWGKLQYKNFKIKRKAHPFMKFIKYYGIVEKRAKSEFIVATNQFKQVQVQQIKKTA